MLSTPKYGWSEITIGDWYDRCSYLDDVPYRLLEAVDYTNRTRRPSAVKFDAEGWEYIIVFDNYETHVINYNEDCEYHCYTVEIYLNSLIRDLIADIRRDIDAWAAWGCDINEYEVEERKYDLQAWCNVIEARL